MSNLNTAEELIAYIKNSTKKTPVKAYINGDLTGVETTAKVFKGDNSYILIGDNSEIERIVEEYKDSITDCYIEMIEETLEYLLWI